MLAGPVRLHPFMGVAEMYTDNVFRTNSKRSDFFTTLAPGIQAQLPIGTAYVCGRLPDKHSVLSPDPIEQCPGPDGIRFTSNLILPVD